MSEQYRQPYPVATMLRARELRDAGWYPTAIRRILTDEGHGSPSLFTIQAWTNGSYQESHRQRMRDRGARRSTESTRFRLRSSSDAYRQAFMERLRSEGVPCASIAKVCGVVFGEEPPVADVRERLRDTRPERHLRAA